MTAYPELTESSRGVVLTIRVQPGARRAAVVGRHGDSCKVKVTAPPVEGKANAAVVELLADAFGLPAREVEVVSGHTGRTKRVALGAVSMAEARARLDALYT